MDDLIQCWCWANLQRVIESRSVRFRSHDREGDTGTYSSISAGSVLRFCCRSLGRPFTGHDRFSFLFFCLVTRWKYLEGFRTFLRLRGRRRHEGGRGRGGASLHPRGKGTGGSARVCTTTSQEFDLPGGRGECTFSQLTALSLLGWVPCVDRRLSSVKRMDVPKSKGVSGLVWGGIAWFRGVGVRFASRYRRTPILQASPLFAFFATRWALERDLGLSFCPAGVAIFYAPFRFARFSLK